MEANRWIPWTPVAPHCPPSLHHVYHPILTASATTDDYDPIHHLNSLFPHPATLQSVPATSLALHNHLESLDNEISQLVTTQSATNADSLSRITAAKTELTELLENIDMVRERAVRTEDAISAMTADIKKLDHTKRNLTLSMTVLKRLQMLSTSLNTR